MVRGELVGGRFYVDRCLSRSAAMAVYRAVDSTDSTPVTVRVFPTLSTAGAAHLERVCSALWRHPHPGIEQIVAWGRGSSGEGYTVARVPDGPTLEEATTDGMREADHYHVVRRALEALAHRHELGLSHGAVSAEAFVLPRGMAGGSLLTETTLVPPSLVLGEGSLPSVRLEHARHLAPEQIRGAAQLSPAADIFALGCTLHHVLSGALPFASTTLLGSHLRTLYAEPYGRNQSPRTSTERSEARAPESQGQRGRDALESLARRMLTKDPAERPTAREALAALSAHTSGPASSPPLSHTAQPRGRFALIVCRLLLQKAPSLESEAELDQAEHLLRAVGGRLDRMVSGLVLVEVTQEGGGDIIDRAGRAALLLQTVLPLAAIVVAEATIGSSTELDRIESLLSSVRSGQIAIQPELIPRLGQRFQVDLGEGRDSTTGSRPPALMWELEPETNPRPSAPRFDAEATLTESGQITMEISVPEGALSGAMNGTLEPMPTVEMDLGPLAQTTRGRDEQ